MNRRTFVQSAAGLAAAYSVSGLRNAIEAATTPYNRPKLKITEIRTAEVRVHGYQMHVRVYADDGLYGQGEATDAAQGGVPLVNSWRRLLIGADPLNVEAIFEQIRTSGIFAGAQSGQYVTALSAVEIALWDLAGKAMGIPVYQLLGGKVRDRVRVYCDSDMRDPLADEASKKVEFVKQNQFTAMKIDVDQATDPNRFDRVNWTANNAEIDRMIKWIQHTRDSIGMNIDLGVDMHGRYDAVTGKRVAKLAEPFRLMWLEEPVPPENVAAMREVKLHSPVPLCAGENLYLRWGFRDLIEQQAVDTIMPDIPKCGGLSECRKIANMAEVYYIQFAPHKVCGPLGTMASAHVCATIPNFLVMEWHWIDYEGWDDFATRDQPVIQQGHVVLTDRPGIGLDVNDEALIPYLRPGTTLFGETPTTP